MPETDPPGVAGTSEPGGAAAATGWRNPRVRRALQAVVSTLLVGGIFWFVLGQFSDLSSVWDAMQTLTWREIAALVVFTIWNLLTYWILVVLATPGLRLPQAAVLTQTTTAVSNALPAGGAIGVGLTYSMLSSWGFSKSRASLSVLVTGIWNNFVKLGTPIVALAVLAVQGESGAGSILAALIGLVGLVAAIVVFGLILRGEPFARRAGLVGQRIASRVRAAFRKGPATGWDLALLKFRSRVLGLVRHRWIAITAATIVSHISLYLVLLTALRTMGVSEQEVGWAQVLAAFAFARLVTAVPLTPGGVGVVELALIAGLSAAGGDRAPVVAAVLVYRLLTYVLPIVLGGLTYLYWRANRSWRDSAPPLPASLAPAAGAAEPAAPALTGG
ncbi:MAG TPA: flippase-like domain-containing protein [Acidimicrobiales bacterium]|nr:flippase-like domain-containing protein [Acidimicrobiales bacterium]